MGWWIFKTPEDIERERREKELKAEQARQQLELKMKKDAEWKASVKNNYEEHKMAYGYTNGRKVVTIKNKQFYAFVHDGEFRLFTLPPQGWSMYDIEEGKMPNWNKRSIALSNIRYFSREGEVYTETHVSGGDSNGSNLIDAVVGGVIAGAPGAIIASRPKTNPVKSKTITHDTRKTILVYNKGKLEFAPDDYHALMKLIPDKELSVVQRRRAMEQSRKPEDTSIESRLEKLKSLRDKDLITEEEYQEKRLDLLDSI